MGKPRVVTDGSDPLTKPILDYLFRVYGMDPSHVKALNLESNHGDAQILTVTLFVQDEDLLQTGEVVNTSGRYYPVGESGPELVDPPTERIFRA